MAGIEDINIPQQDRILGDLTFAENKTDYTSLQSNLLQGMPLLDAIKQFGTDTGLKKI